MKKFLLRLGIFSAIVFLLIFSLSIQWDRKDYKNHYMSSIEDKHKRVRQFSGPRLMFVGGSSTAFGLNCKRIESELKIPTENMAIIASLGLDFMLNEVEAEMREGDIVVLAPEYYLSVEGVYEVKKFTAQCWPEAANYFKQDYGKNLTTVRFKQIKDNLRFLVDSVIKKNKASWPPVIDYTTMYNYRNTFDEHGDVVAHFNLQPPP